MVDSLEGAIAALAISLLCFGISSGSKTWCALGSFVCAFSLFIKPSGVLIMMVFVGVATAEFGVLILENRSPFRPILKRAAFVYLIGFCIFAIALWLALGSDYMSPEVIAKAIKASQFVLPRSSSPPTLFDVLRKSITRSSGCGRLSSYHKVLLKSHALMRQGTIGGRLKRSVRSGTGCDLTEPRTTLWWSAWAP
jgi:hypothetical protein